MLVSVIIPVYNARATLAACIEALLQQQCDFDYELLFVDDGSTDESVSILKRYPVRVIQQANAGPAKARNHGARLAQGQYLLFTDSDCLVDPHWVAEMIRPMRENSQIHGVQGRYLSKQPSLVAQFCQDEIEERYALIQRQGRVQLLGTYAAAYPRELFLKYGGFDECYPVACAEDADLSFRLIKDGHTFAFAQKALVYHHHPATVKKYWRQKFNRGYWRTLLYRRNPEQIVTDNYTPQGLKLQVMLVPVLLVALALSAWQPQAWYLVLAVLVLHALLASKLLAILWRHQLQLFVVGLGLMWVRSLAIFFGLVVGSLDNYLIKPLKT